MKTALSTGLALVCWAVLLPDASAAGPCDDLSAAQRGVADAVFASWHPNSCCLDTIASCLQQRPVCPLARRLERAVCLMSSKGFDKAQVEQALERRKESMVQCGLVASFVMDERFMAGDPAAPVSLVLYACGRSPVCAKLVPALYEEVTTGRLAGKVRIYFRPYYKAEPKEALECSRAMVAAATVGGFWKYLLALYRHYDDFNLCRVELLAQTVGLNENAFKAAYDDLAGVEYLAASKQEAERNKVDAAPTLFIGGRKYVHEVSPEVLTDVLEEEWERVHP